MFLAYGARGQGYKRSREDYFSQHLRTVNFYFLGCIPQSEIPWLNDTCTYVYIFKWILPDYFFKRL